MNLDAFWSRASSTVKQNHLLASRMIDRSSKVGIPYGPFIRRQPFPSYDHCGYHTAFLMLDASLDQGRYHKDHKQFDTIRKIRSTYSNFIRTTSSTLFDGSSVMLLDNDGKSANRLGCDESGSIWFSRFVEGCRRRMGQDWRPDQAVTPDLMLALLQLLETQISNCYRSEETYFQVMVGAYFAVCYVLSLRGPEGLLLDLEGILKHGDSLSHKDCVVIVLWGQVKGEYAERAHLLPCINITSSGIPVRRWIRRATVLARDNNKLSGPLMLHKNGDNITTKQIDDLLHQLLQTLFTSSPHLFPQSAIKNEEDIVLKYASFRSFRRGSNTRAKEKGVSIQDTDTVNRWRGREKAGTRKQGGTIDQLYSDLTLLTGPFLRYTQSM